MEWTVVIRPSTIPNLSWITCKVTSEILRKYILYHQWVKLLNEGQSKEQKGNLCQRREAVSGTASIRNNVEVWLVFLLIDANNKHRSILARSRNDDFLSTTLMINDNNTQWDNYINPSWQHSNIIALASLCKKILIQVITIINLLYQYTWHTLTP